MRRDYWNIKESKSVKLGRFETVYDTVILPNGNKTPYSYVKIKHGVCILPIEENNVYIIKQYRHAIKNWQWELPAGMIDENETPTDAAIRELKEETGFSVKNIDYYGYIYPSAGSTTEIIHLFCATCDYQSEQTLDESEEISIYKIKLSKLFEMIDNNEFLHSAGIILTLKYFYKKNNNISK